VLVDIIAKNLAKKKKDIIAKMDKKREGKTKR
jgi:hypothetical protein